MVKLMDKRVHRPKITFSRIEEFSRIGAVDGLEMTRPTRQPLQPLLKPFEADELPKNSLVFDD